MNERDYLEQFEGYLEQFRGDENPVWENRHAFIYRDVKYKSPYSELIRLRKRALEMTEKGNTVQEIAKELSVTASRVKGWLKRAERIQYANHLLNRNRPLY